MVFLPPPPSYHAYTGRGKCERNLGEKLKKIKGDEKFVHIGGGGAYSKKLKYVVYVADCISGGGGKTIFEGVRVGVMCRRLV
jgi:hypothetical protein